MKKSKKALIIVFASFGGVVITALSVFFIYFSFYYRATAEAKSYLISNETIDVDHKSFYWSFKPKNNTTNKGIIFYPGAKVEATSYAPLMSKICVETETVCTIVEMPFNFAFFGRNRANTIINDYSDIDTWYLAGHSFGGVMASEYTKNNLDKISGIIFLASYPISDFSKTNLTLLTIYGSEDKVFNINAYNNSKKLLPETSNEKIIEGGNHAGFGMYGHQNGDGDATISNEEQINQTAIFIKENI